MLVLGRKEGETLYIGDDICITVTSISGDKVRIGIDAPKSLSVMRGELLQVINANKASAQTSENAVHSLAASLKLANMQKKKPEKL